MRLVVPLMRGNDARDTQHDVAPRSTDFGRAAKWAITSGIGGPEEGHRACAERNGEMQRAGIARNDAFGAMEQRHELPKRASMNDRRCSTACRHERLN